MRVLVVGAGVVGTIYGWALAASGNDVVHLVRPGRAGRLANGVTLDVLDRRKGHHDDAAVRYPITVTESVPRSADLVVVPTKPYQLTDAVRALTSTVDTSATYLLLTQNWRGTAEVDALLSRDRYLYGDAQAGGTFVDGTLVCAIFPRIVLGSADGGRGEAVERVAGAFAGAAIRPVARDDILHTIWVQYAINAGLLPPMVRAGGLSELLRDRALGEASLLAAAECLRVVAARGVDLRRYREAGLFLRTRSKLGRTMAGVAMRSLFRFSKAVTRTSAHALADPREIEEAYNDLVTEGRRLGVAMPVMASFEDDVRSFASRRGVHITSQGTDS
jgi:2-dehydropantoate 2-reductase